ncbi:MAG TPA: LAGLIDADG family homing endonuclease [Euzebyales bacterium]|nr:LAGLIDADG family homing endonuclease [Euzebyales bacterium]
MERDKALDMALGQIEKQFGKGAIMRMGDDTQVEVAAIPTGALSLDIALGVGGLPRGRVVEIYGPESSGKCLTADTAIWTDGGLETIAELFERCGQPVSCTSRVTDISDLGVRVVNERGELEQVTALTHNDRHPVLRVRLRSGRTVSATENHPLRVINERGFIVWRTAGALAVGDHVVSAAFGAAEAAEGDGLTEDEAVLLGYLVAEGSLSSRSAIRFTNTDIEVGAEFSALVRRLFDRETRCYDQKQYAVHDTALRAEVAERYGLTYVIAAGKTVPPCVRTSGHKAQRAFLSALFEGDGWIDASSTVGLDTASEALARQVHLLLYGFGIPSTVSSSFNTTYERDHWRVTINPSVAHRFLDEIGFRSARRDAQVAANFRRSPRDAQSENLLAAAPQALLRSQRPGEPDGPEGIPNIAGLIRDLRDDLGGDRAFDRCAGDLFHSDMNLACSRQRLGRIIDWADSRSESWTPTSRAIVGYLRHLLSLRYTFERVDAIEDGGVQPTFDIVLPETHSFIANGMLSHNTTVALHAIAEAQRDGGIAAFIDAEHALDPRYAAALGVDIESLLVSQPDTGEQALEITDMLVRSGAVDIVVVDSVAALTPRAEIEGEMGDSHVGLQARLMSQALRKLAGTLSKSNTCAIFINQIREKIGVMFGCFSSSTRVTLADGTQEKIGRIVSQRLPVEVLSYDPALDRVVPRRVTNWFDNGPTTDFCTIVVARATGNGRSQFSCTPNHLVRTPGGWCEAGDLKVGDRVLQSVDQRLSDMQWEVVLGGLLGASALSPTRSGFGAGLRWGHDATQTEYADWKATLFDNIGTSRSTNVNGTVFHDMRPHHELAELRDAVHIGDRKVVSHDYLKRVTPLALAIWYADDGTFTLRSKGLQERTRGGSGRSEICVEALEPTSRVRLQEHLRDEYGIEARLVTTARNALMRFSTPETAKLHRLIAPYVHPSMDYKLLPSERGRFDVTPVFDEPRSTLAPMPVIDIRQRPLPADRVPHRYDIEVDGTHNYFVDGVMVHNSPETQPGGRALKFYSSVRLDVRRIESLKDGTDFVGNRVRVKVVKNKVAPPFRQAEFDILFGEGISQEGSILDVGVDAGFIRKAGAWYTYDGEQLGQGRENARNFLREHDDVAAEIYKKVTEHLGLTPSETDGGDSDEGDPDGIL